MKLGIKDSFSHLEEFIFVSLVHFFSGQLFCMKFYFEEFYEQYFSQGKKSHKIKIILKERESIMGLKREPIIRDSFLLNRGSRH